MANPYIDSIKQNQNKTQSSSVSSNRYIRSLTTPQQETVQPKRKATPQQTEQLFSRFGIKKPVEKKTDFINIAKLPDFSKSIISKVKIDSPPREKEFVSNEKFKENFPIKPKEKTKKEPFKIKDIPTKIIDSFKEDLERRAGNFKEGIDFYSDMFTGVIKESSSGRPEVGRVGGTLKDIRESKYSLQNPAPAYEPKTAGEKAGSLVWKLTEDINVFKLNQLETPFDVGIKSITSTPKYQYIQAKIKESVVKAGKSVVDNLTKLNQKIRPLKITFEDISAVTKGTGTPQQRIKFDKFQELRATGMPIEEILAAGKDSKPTTKIADFLDDVIAKIKKSFGKELSKEEQKLLTSGAKDASIVIDSGTYESQEILDKVLTTPLQETKEGKILIKEAVEAKVTGQVIKIEPKEPPKPIVEPSKTTKTTKAEPILDNLNPTGGLFVDYTPEARMKIKLGDNITTLDKTSKKPPETITTIYRGAPKSQKQINPGDFVTTNETLAGTYGENILSKEVKMSDVLDDKTEPLGEEYLYRPQKAVKKVTKKELEIVDKNRETIDKLQTEVGDILKKNVGESGNIEKLPSVDRKKIDSLRKQIKTLGEENKQLIERPVKKATKKVVKKVPKKVKPKKKTPKVKAKKTRAKLVPRSQVPVGEGKIKVSALEARIKKALGNLSEEQIKEMGLATHKEMNKKANIAKASKYVTENTEDAMRVLEGKIDAPKGIARNSILVAMQNLSPKDMSLDMATRLASLFSTRAGQEISILTEVNKNLPVNILSDIIQIRTQAVEKRFGKTIDKITKAKVKKGETMIKAPTNWDSFLREVRC